MIITCRECDSKFVLDDKLIKPTGSKVRCSSCKHVFKVFPETDVLSSLESQPLSPESDPVAIPSEASSSSHIDTEDDLAKALDRELDRFFGPDEGDSFDAAPEIEIEPSFEAASPVVPAAPLLESIEDIDLDDLGLDDLGLTGPSSAQVSEEYDLSSLDLDLFSDDGVHVSPGEEEEMVDILAPPVSADPDASDGEGPGNISEESFDFTEIESSRNEVGGDQSLLFDESLDFSDIEADDQAPLAPIDGVEEELDFSDFALSFSDDASESELAGDTGEISLSLGEGDVEAVNLDGRDELDLSLDDDFFEIASKGTESHPSIPKGRLLEENESMALELDLDLEADDAMPEDVENSLDEGLDLSELEKLLQEAPISTEVVREDDDIELELDFDYVEETEEMEPLSMESLDASDFSDIEAMLEKDDKPLDAAAGHYGAMDLDLDLDLDISHGVETDTAVSSQWGQDETVALAEVNDEAPDGIEPTPSRATALNSLTQDSHRSGGLRIFFTLLMVLVLLFAILGGGYALRDKIRDRTGIAIPTITLVETVREKVATLGIPAVSDWVRPEAKDIEGHLKLVTQDVAGRFVTSPILGDLFVITGKVRNNYSMTRHSIRLMGRLFNKEKREVQEKEFFAGNTMSDEELATLPMVQVDERLRAPLGDGNINARVRPGQLVSFMVVYANLPDDLTEFAVEVKESKEGVAIQ